LLTSPLWPRSLHARSDQRAARIPAVSSRSFLSR
jgi:hypothetical protein